VSDPRAPSPRLPAPDAPAPDRADADGRSRGHRALPLVLLLVGLAAGSGASELRHLQRDRAADAVAAVAEAEAAAVLDLRLEAGDPESGSVEQSSGQGLVLRRDLAVRNVGARTVRLLGAELVGSPLSWRSGGRALGHGEDAEVGLAGEVQCPGGSPDFARPGSVLRVRAETQAGERSTDLPVPPALLADLQASADRDCGVVPVGEAVHLEQVGTALADDRVTLHLQLFVATAAPVDLVDVTSLVPGVRAAVRTGGRPPVFPFRLESRGAWPRIDPGASDPLDLQVVLSVDDCSQARRAGADRFTGDELVRFAVEADGAGADVLAYDQGDLARVVDHAC